LDEQIANPIDRFRHASRRLLVSTLPSARAVSWAIAIAGALLALVDRWRWAGISQWREDQATNLWLGYTRSIFEIPVGLISSRGIPNPNGMPLVGSVLALLPDALWASWALGAAQCLVIVALCASLSAPAWARLVTGAVLLSSVLLRATSVEFWNNWVLTTVNLAMALSVVRYLRRPTPRWIPLWVGCSLIAPALYLAGLVNALLFVGTGAALLLAHPPRARAREWAAVAAVSAVLLALSLAVTWKPFFDQIGDVHAMLDQASDHRDVGRIVLAALSAANAPLWHTSDWLSPSSFVILQNDPALMTPVASSALDWSLTALATQRWVFLGTLAAAGLAAVLAFRDGRIRALASDAGVRQLAWVSGMLVAAYVLSPLVGGPVWAEGERLEMAVCFVPFLLVAWFLAPSVLPMAPVVRWIAGALTVAVALGFVAVNAVLGESILASTRAYRGSVLPNSDVPLSQRMEVVDFIASDWRAVSRSDTVPVDYFVGGGKWDWVPAFGRALERWYPAPMTMGRIFDFDLLRRHALRNYEEGSPRRRWAGRYIVTYAFEPPPLIPGRGVTHRVFGRLRVTVVQ
jgi:hypothetical protein